MRSSLRLSVFRKCVGKYLGEGGGEVVGTTFRCLTGAWPPSGDAFPGGKGWAPDGRTSYWQNHFRGYGSKSTTKTAKMYVRNEDITAPELRVVLQDGTHKVMSRGEALQLVMTQKLDLVLITADSVPPVAKIMNFSKFKHGRQTAERKIASATRVREKLKAPKEVRVRPRISDHDLQQKLKKISEFLAKGFKVTVAIMFKGDQEKKMASEALHFIVKMVEENDSVEVLTAPDSASRRNSIAAMISPVPDKGQEPQTSPPEQDGVTPSTTAPSTPTPTPPSPPPPPPPSPPAD
ncbi:hypothetical protein BSKO_09115 [Bryopsis sp. KO-2023]|nr:hypothetical protein BSKO_09115 [Bryopsis sp. KO-2023]